MPRPACPTSRSSRPRSCTSARRCRTAINPPILDCATKDQHPQTYRGSLGATNYYLKKFGKNALHGVFLYPSDLKSAKNSQVPAFTAQQKAGIKQDATFDVSARAQQSAYTPFVQAIKDSGVHVRPARRERRAVDLASMKEAKIQGVNTVKVWDCSLQCYDKDILADAAETEGLYVWIPVPAVRGDQVQQDARAELPQVHRRGQGRRLRHSRPGRPASSCVT